MIVLSHWYLLEVLPLLQKNWILFYQFSFLHWQILYWFFFTHEASHNKWLKVYWFIIVHLLCFKKPAPSYIFTFFATCFFPYPYPDSSNLIHSLKPSSIYELSPVFSVVMLCLQQLRVLLCNSSVSLMCYQVPLLPLEWP